MLQKNMNSKIQEYPINGRVKFYFTKWLFYNINGIAINHESTKIKTYDEAKITDVACFDPISCENRNKSFALEQIRPFLCNIYISLLYNINWKIFRIKLILNQHFRHKNFVFVPDYFFFFTIKI